MNSIMQKRYIQVALLLIVVGLTYQNCSQSGQNFSAANSAVSVGSPFTDINGNGVDDKSEAIAPANYEGIDGGNSEGPIIQKSSQYKVCNISSTNEPYKFSDLVEFGGTVDLPGVRIVQYDITDKSKPTYATKRINESLRDFLQQNFSKAGLKNSDFIKMVPGEIYHPKTGNFQPVTPENVALLKSALTLTEEETGMINLLPLPGYFFTMDVYGANRTTPQKELENFVGNLRFSHITSVFPHLIGHVVLQREFLDIPKSIASTAKNNGLTLDSTKTLEIPSHKRCYLPQYDGSILERQIDLVKQGDTVKSWNESDGRGMSNYGQRIQRCFHDDSKMCVSDNWLHRPNGFSDRIYNVEIQ